MEVFSILAPLMEGTEGLKKAEEALNLAKIGAMFDLMRGVLDLLLVATIISRQSAIKLTIYLLVSQRSWLRSVGLCLNKNCW